MDNRCDLCEYTAGGLCGSGDSGLVGFVNTSEGADRDGSAIVVMLLVLEGAS